MEKENKNILLKMFDIRPVDKRGELDLEKIMNSAGRVVRVEKDQWQASKSKKAFPVHSDHSLRGKGDFKKGSPFKPRTITFNRFLDNSTDQIITPSAYKKRVFFSDVAPRGETPDFLSEKKAHFEKQRSSKGAVFSGFSPGVLNSSVNEEKEQNYFKESVPKIEKVSYEDFFSQLEGKEQAEKTKESSSLVPKASNLPAQEYFSKSSIWPKFSFWSYFGRKRKKKKGFFKKFKSSLFSKIQKRTDQLREMELQLEAVGEEAAESIWPFVSSLLAVLLLVNVFSFVSLGFQIKDNVQVKGVQAINKIFSAKEELEEADFDGAQESLLSARNDFSKINQEIKSLGGELMKMFSAVPVLSKANSAQNVFLAGERLTEGASLIAQAAENFYEAQKSQSPQNRSLLISESFLAVQNKTEEAKKLFQEAQDLLEKVNLADIPEEHRKSFLVAKKAVPAAIKAIEYFQNNQELFSEFMGINGPRKFLILFQNNNEMRATGGFIGSYAIVSVSNGQLKNIFIDGIYNPDGQLKENIIPPRPIRKISAGWSTHDANWFPNFPDSAQKIAWFYEKTGGPTVDGVIAITPVVLEKLLKISGPIEMEDYGVVVDSENFIETTQFKVEVDYDRTENRPKRFIADLAPLVINKIMQETDLSQAANILSVFSSALKEKHIQIYSFDSKVQKLLSQQGWSGEIKSTDKDFLMVVNSNLNGFKTDGVIDEYIDHKATINQDGSVIAEIKIRRVHNGGDEVFEWFNKVNSNYMRIYVPLGSQLLEAEGYTREVVEDPLNYERLGFKEDPDVKKQEESIKFDEETGTRIYEENGKTVFANWVYVSPKEEVTVRYKYLLPFKVDLTENEFASYSLLAQKQAGSRGSKFSSQLELPENFKKSWLYPESSIKEDSRTSLSFSSILNEDKFWGVVFSR